MLGGAFKQEEKARKKKEKRGGERGFKRFRSHIIYTENAVYMCWLLLSHGQRGGCPLSWNAGINTSFLYGHSSDIAAHCTAVDVADPS